MSLFLHHIISAVNSLLTDTSLKRDTLSWCLTFFSHSLYLGSPKEIENMYHFSVKFM